MAQKQFTYLLIGLLCAVIVGEVQLLKPESREYEKKVYMAPPPGKRKILVRKNPSARKPVEKIDEHKDIDQHKDVVAEHKPAIRIRVSKD